MLPGVIIDTVRYSRREVLVRDLVRDLQDKRRREGEAWARRVDPLGLGAFPQGRRILVQTVGPASYRPNMVELEVLDELRRMARRGEVRLAFRGEDLNPDRQPVTLDTSVRIP